MQPGLPSPSPLACPALAGSTPCYPATPEGKISTIALPVCSSTLRLQFVRSPVPRCAGLFTNNPHAKACTPTVPARTEPCPPFWDRRVWNRTLQKMTMHCFGRLGPACAGRPYPRILCGRDAWLHASGHFSRLSPAYAGTLPTGFFGRETWPQVSAICFGMLGLHAGRFVGRMEPAPSKARIQWRVVLCHNRNPAFRWMAHTEVRPPRMRNSDGGWCFVTTVIAISRFG